MAAQILVKDLQKNYRVPEREEGLRATIRTLFRRRYREVTAVNDINFTIQPGEVVGFIGPNGAGKTTTLKILSGLLYPTAGEVCVAGFIPWQREIEFLRCISMVMTNKNQLNWENTAMDSFRVLAEIYRVPPRQFQETLADLTALLDMTELLPQMVRNLSLGQRMKCELVAALLHCPQILFLDEPTLGLDISMQLNLRHFLAEYNQRHGATVIITSHYMADVTALCSRVILIDKGQLLYDGDLNQLATRIAPFKLVKVTTGLEDDMTQRSTLLASLAPIATVLGENGRQLTLRVPKEKAAQAITCLLTQLPVIDISVEDPPIEAVIDQVYRQGISP
jgi:ABC-2 type transport system ATP-binding protein